MTPHVEIDIEEVVADVDRVIGMVEHDRATVAVLRDDTVIAVISPAQIAETLADIHRAIQENPLEGTSYLDVMETRRLLGL